MKATKLLIRIVPIAAEPKTLDLSLLLEQVLLNSPASGMSSDLFLRGAVVYGRLVDERKKNAGKTEWVWWLEAEHHKTLCDAIDLMRWGKVEGDVRIIAAEFVKEVKDAKEEEVPIAEPAT